MVACSQTIWSRQTQCEIHIYTFGLRRERERDGNTEEYKKSKKLTRRIRPTMSFSSSFLFFLLFCFILRSPRRWLYTRSRFAAGLSAFFFLLFPYLSRWFVYRTFFLTWNSIDHSTPSTRKKEKKISEKK